MDSNEHRWRYAVMASRLIFIIGIGFFTACSTMSKKECMTANWETVGFGDGANGRSASRIERHRKACAGITSPDLNTYTKGHDRGLRQYCTANRGYHSGAGGRRANTECIKIPESDYQVAFDFGRTVYNADRQVERHTQSLTDAHQALVDVEHKIKRIEAQLVAEGVSTRERIAMLEHSKALAAAIPEYNLSIDDQEQALMDAINVLNRVNAGNPYANNPPVAMPTISVTTPPDPVPVSRHPDHDQPESPRSHSGRPDGGKKRVDYQWFRHTSRFALQNFYQDFCRQQTHARNRKTRNQLNEHLLDSKLAPYNCRVAQIGKGICKRNSWSTVLSCTVRIQNKSELFGGQLQCHRDNATKCRISRISNLTGIKKRDVPSHLLEEGSGGIAACFRNRKKATANGASRINSHFA